MAYHSSLRCRNRPECDRFAVIGSRILPTLMSIAIIAAAKFADTAAFVEGADGKFGEGSNSPGGIGPAGSPVDTAAGAAGGSELESWDADFDRLNSCAHRRDVAEACAACPGLAPNFGITAWQCCHDAGARRVCVETVTAALLDRATGYEDGDNLENDEGDDVVDKRAKYFLGKRAKYFLGKRAFGTRRMTGYRPATRHEMMAEEISLLGSGRRAHGDRSLDAEKRAKYFLG